MRHCHNHVHHQRRQITHEAIRQAGYWVIGGHRTVARELRKCVVCKKFRGSLFGSMYSRPACWRDWSRPALHQRWLWYFRTLDGTFKENARKSRQFKTMGSRIHLLKQKSRLRRRVRHHGYEFVYLCLTKIFRNPRHCILTKVRPKQVVYWFLFVQASTSVLRSCPWSIHRSFIGVFWSFFTACSFHTPGVKIRRKSRSLRCY